MRLHRVPRYVIAKRENSRDVNCGRDRIELRTAHFLFACESIPVAHPTSPLELVSCHCKVPFSELETKNQPTKRTATSRMPNSDAYTLRNAGHAQIKEPLSYLASFFCPRNNSQAIIEDGEVCYIILSQCRGCPYIKLSNFFKSGNGDG